MMITELKVMGDHEVEYTISATKDGTPTCSCPAFIYYQGAEAERSCKHIRFVAQLLQSVPA